MAKNKQIDYSDVKQAVKWILVIVGVFVGLYFFAPMAHSQTVRIISGETGFLHDSITYEHYIEDSTADSSGVLCTSCTGWSDTLTISANQWHDYYLYFWTYGQVNKGSWYFQTAPSDTTSLSSSSVWSIRANWQDSAISTGYRLWQIDGTTITSYTEQAASTDSNYQYHINIPTTAASAYYLSVDINFPGNDSTTSWVWQKGDISIGGTVTTPSSANLCNVYGSIYDAMNNAVQYADVVFTCTGIINICDSVTIGKATYKAKTTSTGAYSINLLKNSCMKGDKVWTVQATYTDYNGNVIQTNKYFFEIPADSSSYKLLF